MGLKSPSPFYAFVLKQINRYWHATKSFIEDSHNHKSEDKAVIHVIRIVYDREISLIIFCLIHLL